MTLGWQRVWFCCAPTGGLGLHVRSSIRAKMNSRGLVFLPPMFSVTTGISALALPTERPCACDFISFRTITARTSDKRLSLKHLSTVKMCSVQRRYIEKNNYQILQHFETSSIETSSRSLPIAQYAFTRPDFQSRNRLGWVALRFIHYVSQCATTNQQRSRYAPRPENNRRELTAAGWQ